MIRWLRGFLLATLLLLTALGGAAFLAGDHLLDRPQVRAYLISRAEQDTDWQWAIGAGPNLRWRPLPELILWQVELRTAPDHSLGANLHAREVRIAFGWNSLLQAKWPPARITALDLTARLTNTPALGQSTGQALGQGMGQGTGQAIGQGALVTDIDLAEARVELVGGADTASRRPGPRELVVKGGQVRLSAPEATGTTAEVLRITDLSLELEPLAGAVENSRTGSRQGATAGARTATGQPAGAQLRAQGQVLGRLPASQATWTARINLTSGLAPVEDADILELPGARLKLSHPQAQFGNIQIRGPDAELLGDLRLARRARVARIDDMRMMLLGLNFYGHLATALGQGVPTAQGQLAIDAFDPRDWLSNSGFARARTMLARVPAGLRSLAARLDFHLSPRALRIESLWLELDETQAQGRASLGFGAQPRALFSLSLDQLDLGRYLPSGAGTPAAGISTKPPSFRPSLPLSPMAADAIPARSETALAQAPNAHGPGQRGESIHQIQGKRLGAGLVKVSTAAASGSTRTPTPKATIAGPGAFWRVLQASGEIEVQRLRLSPLALGPVEFKPRLQSQRLTTDFSAPDFYAGRIGGYLELTPLGAMTPALKLLAKGEGVQIAPLLRDLNLGLAASGGAEIGLELTATGGDWARISRSLGGEAALLLRDLRLEGISLDQLLAASGLSLPSTGLELPQLDAFTELSASFQGGSGHFRSEDVSAEAPRVRISGTGLVQLPERNIDFDLTAVPRESAHGAGVADADGLALPLRIRGDWTAPRITADPGPALREAAARALERKLDKHGDKLRALEERTGIRGLEQSLRSLLGTRSAP